MYYIRDIYDIFNNNYILIGKELVIELEDEVIKKDILIGNYYTLEDFLAAHNNLNINRKKDFITEKYSNITGVTGIIYFPQVNKWGFSDSSDIIVDNEEQMNLLLNAYTVNLKPSYTPTTVIRSER